MKKGIFRSCLAPANPVVASHSPDFDVVCNAQLLALLNDGKFHSDREIASTLSVSRSAVSKSLTSLLNIGLKVQTTGQEYRLTYPLELLEHDLILAAMDKSSQAHLSGLEIHQDIDSTNGYLMRSARGDVPSGYVCLAEHQQAGRGRQGRQWVSPFASNIYASLLWRFHAGPASLAGLSLAAGVATVRALQEAGVEGVGLKWPNDVLWQGRKLAGVLVDTAAEPAGPCHAVIGVGLNVAMPAQAGEAIGQPWVDVQTILSRPVRRNPLAGLLLQHLLSALHEFENTGLPAFLREWAAWDLTKGKRVTLQLHDQTITGVALGIDADGALRLSVGGTIQTYLCGELSLRESI